VSAYGADRGRPAFLGQAGGRPVPWATHYRSSCPAVAGEVAGPRCAANAQGGLAANLLEWIYLAVFGRSKDVKGRQPSTLLVIRCGFFSPPEAVPLAPGEKAKQQPAPIPEPSPRLSGRSMAPTGARAANPGRSPRAPVQMPIVGRLRPQTWFGWECRHPARHARSDARLEAIGRNGPVARLLALCAVAPFPSRWPTRWGNTLVRSSADSIAAPSSRWAPWRYGALGLMRQFHRCVLDCLAP